jgi:hypothetical protein
MRHQHPVLSLGSFQRLYADGDVYGFRRTYSDEEALVFFNAGTSAQTIEISATALHKSTYQSIWGPTHGYAVANDVLSVTVPARDAAILWHPS